MDTTLDRFGRVVIPKLAREVLGIEPGDNLIVETRNGEIVLRPEKSEQYLVNKGGLLVYTGKLLADPDQILQEIREERMQHIAGVALEPESTT